jgi:hypothetical protein
MHILKFTALQTFEHKAPTGKILSRYLEGQVYRAGERVESLIATWAKEGKISPFIAPGGMGEGVIAGAGTVEPIPETQKDEG